MKGALVERGEVVPEVFAGVAEGERGVLYGRSGAVQLFGARGPTPSGVLSPGRLRFVAAAADGRAWAASELGLFAWKGKRWERDDTVPWKRPVEALAAAGNDLWAIADGHAYRSSGGRWKVMTDDSVAVHGLFARGPADVFAFGWTTLRHWDGRAWSEVAKAKPGFSWRRVTGSSTAVYALAQGPRLEEADGPSTGLPDEILVLEPGAPPRWIAAAGRPSDLALVRGELWGTAPWSAARWSQGQWVPMREAAGTAIVPTAQGALFLSDSYRVTEWNGERFTELTLPGPPTAGISSRATVWLVGDESAMRRTR